MTQPFSHAPPITLRSLDHQVSGDITIEGSGTAITVGRQDGCDALIDVAAVSRTHAELRLIGGRWHLADLASRHGTYLNDARLAQRPVPLAQGDRVEFGPVAFSVALDSASENTEETPATLISTIASDDGAEIHSTVSSHESSRLGIRASDLRDIMADLRDASSPEKLYARAAKLIVSHLRGGRSLFVRPAAGFDKTELLAASPSDGAPRPLSRTLLRDASEQGFVCLRRGSRAVEAKSIISAGVTDAWCTPIVVNGHHAAYLYVDSESPIPVGEEAVAIVLETVSSVVEFALDRFARHTIEERFDVMERELSAARTVQLRLMPKTTGTVGGRRYTLRCEAGYYVAGDIFGVGTRPDGRAYAYLGDVTGHGVAPSLIMSATKSHLDALLASDLPLGHAVTRLNTYLATVTSGTEFVTLAALEFDDESGAVTIVDAGHGYIMLQRSDGSIEIATVSGGIPVGIDEDAAYAESTLPCDGLERIVLLSDGIPEQMNVDRVQFGLDACSRSILTDGTFRALFESLESHAGPAGFSDDVTIASIDVKRGAGTKSSLPG